MTPARPPAVRRIEGGKVLALPGPSSGARSAVDAGTRIVGSRLDLGAVSDLLHHSYGVTQRASGDLQFRAAASAGALYPTDVFVVARADSALAPGVHYYDPEAHTLVTLGGLDRAERVIQSLPGDSPGRNAPILVVLGATFDRSVFKYDTRAYRYVGLDAGHVALNLLEAGEALGLACVLEPWFDDRALASAVGLDADGEGVLLAAGCGGRVRGGPRSAPAHRPVQLPDSADELELTRLSHLLTSWQLAESQAPARDAGLGPIGARLGRHADVLALIRERRSFRSFRSEAVTRADLDAVLDAARAGSEALGRPTLVDVLVAARAVTGLSAGSHRLRDALEPIASDPNISLRVQQAGLDQEVLGRAAFVVVFSLRQDAGGSDGPRDLRHALLQAGLGGQAVYLESAARGLGACGVGAFFDDELAALFEPGTRPLHLVAVGKK